MASIRFALLASMLAVVVGIVSPSVVDASGGAPKLSDPKIEHDMLVFESIDHFRGVVEALAAEQSLADDAGEVLDVFADYVAGLGFESMAAEAAARRLPSSTPELSEAQTADTAIQPSDAHIADPYLRSLLNPRSEIAVGDAIYWITPGGFYSITERDVESLDRLQRGEVVTAKTIDFDPLTRRDVEPLPPSCCWANEQRSAVQGYGVGRRIRATQWVINLGFYSSIGARVEHQRWLNGQWQPESATHLDLWGGFDVSRNGCSDDLVTREHFSRSGADVDELRFVQIYLTPDARVRQAFDTTFVAEHWGATGSVELSHCGCREATIAVQPPSGPIGPAQVRIDGSASRFESRFSIEIAEVASAGSHQVVTGTEWSRWFHGEFPANLDLSAHYPFMPNRFYRLRMAVQNGCTPWDEQVEWIETAKTDLGLLYRAHVRGAGWLDWQYESGLAGTVSQNRRLEAFQIEWVGQIGNVDLCYRADVDGLGWMSEVCNGAVAGTTYQGRRMERLTIEPRPSLAAFGCHIEYRGHSRGSGWGPWERDGTAIGVDGVRLEAIEVRLVGCS